MNGRLEIRKKMIIAPKDLAVRIVQNVTEFKEELTCLEKDNRELERKNAHLETIIEKLKVANKSMLEELKNKEAKLEGLLKTLEDDICYDCSHILNCGKANLCIYCDHWVCHCCIKWCPVDDCIIQICDSCRKYHFFCPSHNPNFPREELDIINKKYNENRYKGIN